MEGVRGTINKIRVDKEKGNVLTVLIFSIRKSTDILCFPSRSSLPPKQRDAIEMSKY